MIQSGMDVVGSFCVDKDILHKNIDFVCTSPAATGSRQKACRYKAMKISVFEWINLRLALQKFAILWQYGFASHAVIPTNTTYPAKKLCRNKIKFVLACYPVKSNPVNR